MRNFTKHQREAVGPGSGSHWSDQYRSVTGNMMMMSRNTFEGFYNVDITSTQGKFDFAKSIAVSGDNSYSGDVFFDNSTKKISFKNGSAKSLTTYAFSDQNNYTTVYDIAQNGGMTDFSNSNMALTVGGAIYGALEGATAGDGYWLGKNGKYNTNMTGRGPNQYTGSRTAALNSAKTYKLAGRATVVASAAIGIYSTREGYILDGGQFGYNAQLAAASSAGSIAGGIAGAKGGALIGAGIGVWFGGVGAVPGAVIGGFIGGIGGSLFGGYAGESAVDYYHGR